MFLKDKNAIVTGSAKRLGRAITLALAEKGMNIAVHYHESKEDALRLVETIEGLGCKSFAVRADCKNRKEIHSAVDKSFEKFNEVHLLINNAAVFGPSNFPATDDEEWDKYLNVNLKAPFYFAQCFAKNNRLDIAKIVNLSDTYGASPAAAFIPYGTSKGAIIPMTKGLAKAMAPNVLVNCVCPGTILPPENSDESRYKKAVSATLLKRQGHINDITKAVLFLAENDYMTGQAIFVDGGHSV